MVVPKGNSNDSVCNMGKSLDLITIGRSSVDLYGGQVGGRLEDMASFNKYIGGSPTNIAVGAARLGLKSALITRVGDEHMGRFIREELQREGVDVSGVITDRDRLTALVLLGIRDESSFPLIFYREDCADMALSIEDIDPDFLAKARCVCATGTHLSNPQTTAAVLRAIELAKKNGAKTALDIDYRPNLWGLAGHDAGESRYIESQSVTDKLIQTLGLFDLIVGTEEEFHIAGGTVDTTEALISVRKHTEAVLVCKRGPLGAIAFEDEIPDDIEDGVTGPGIDIEVFNVLGAGDGFMAGLLYGWLSNCDWQETLKTANACGAFAVSRHGCAPSYPTREELEFFFMRGQRNRALRHDRQLEQVHWATTRRSDLPTLRIMNCTGTAELKAAVSGESRRNLPAFQSLCLKAVLSVARSRPGYGIILDSETGRRALFEAASSDLWIGRQASREDSDYLSEDLNLGTDLGVLTEWPLEHVLHLQCLCHASNQTKQWLAQLNDLQRIFALARRLRLETALQLSPADSSDKCDDSCVDSIERLYSHGIFPDWWALASSLEVSTFRHANETIQTHDPNCRGVLSADYSLGTNFHVSDGQESTDHTLARGFLNDPNQLAPLAKCWANESLGDADVIEQLVVCFSEACSRFNRSIARSNLPL